MFLNKLFKRFFVTIEKSEKKEGSFVAERHRYMDADSLAMKVSATYSAVKLISEAIASLPIELQRYNKAQGCYVPVKDDPLYQALMFAPNKRLTAFFFWREALRHIFLRGNAYIIPKKNIYGEIYELTLCSPGAVTHDPLNDTYFVHDVINDLYGSYTSADLVHLRNIGVDGGYTGVSTISAAAASLGISALADEYTTKSLTDRGLIRGFLSGDAGGTTWGAPNTQQVTGVATRLEQDIASGKAVISVPAEMKFTPLALSPGDAKVLENKQMSIREIARFFRVHPELLYEGTNNTYKSGEMPNVMFLHQTLAPLLTQIEGELLVKLMPRSLWGSYRFCFDREKMYLTDLTTEIAYMKGTLESGVYTINDWRSKKGIPRIAKGDAALVSANLKTLDALVAEGSPLGDSTCNIIG